MILNSVDFPLPEGPIIESTFPFSRVKEISFNTSLTPKDLEMCSAFTIISDTFFSSILHLAFQYIEDSRYQIIHNEVKDACNEDRHCGELSGRSCLSQAKEFHHTDS